MLFFSNDDPHVAWLLCSIQLALFYGSLIHFLPSHSFPFIIHFPCSPFIFFARTPIQSSLIIAFSCIISNLLLPHHLSIFSSWIASCFSFFMLSFTIIAISATCHHYCPSSFGCAAFICIACLSSCIVFHEFRHVIWLWQSIKKFRSRVSIFEDCVGVSVPGLPQLDKDKPVV